MKQVMTENTDVYVISVVVMQIILQLHSFFLNPLKTNI